MSAGVFAQRGGHLQRTFAGAGGRHVAAEGYHFAVFVADFTPAFANLFDVAALEILGEQHARVALNAGVAGILCGDAIRVAAEVTRRNQSIRLRFRLLTSAPTRFLNSVKPGQPLLRNAINPGLAVFAAQLFKGRNGLVGFSLTQQGIGFLEPFLAHSECPGTDLHGLCNGHGFGHFGEHRRVRIGQDAEGCGRTFPEEPGAHVGLVIHGIAAVASAEGINVGDGDVVRSFGFDKNFALR